MTQPDPSAEPAAIEPVQPAEPGTGTQEPTPFDPSSLSPEAKAYLKSQVEAAGFKARDNARKTAAEEARNAVLAEFKQKLGLEPTQELSAEELSSHLEEAQAATFKANVENQMLRIGTRLGLDVDSAMDSNRFMDDFIDGLDETEGVTDLNPRSKEFAAAVEKAINSAVEKNPRFKATGGPRPDPSQGARGAGPSLDSRIAEAQKAGRWREVISLQNQKLANT